MKDFMDEDFLLNSEAARTLYHDYAEKMPILDYHCHISPKEIYEDKHFDNITELWLKGDHYKWRLLRWNGVEEKYITGSASDHDKFIKWAETIERAIGNPVYHWSHLELKRYFGYNGVLNAETAEEVWKLCNEKLSKEGMSTREIMRSSGVKLICTTDDPADSLEYHEKLAEDGSFDVRVLPAFRPDNIVNIENPGYAEYVLKLGLTAGIEIKSYGDIKKVLSARMDFFAKHGCRLADHGLEYVPYERASEEAIEKITKKVLDGTEPSCKEARSYRTAILYFLGTEYSRRGWTMQLHYGVKRNSNQKMFNRIGPDTGYDCILNGAPAAELADFLNMLAEKDSLPKTIIYSLDPNDNAIIESIIGCFQDSEYIGKLQHGSAWWFNDCKTGMQSQMISLANEGILGNFIGMLTDSRSFISYTRHEYFRRIMCDIIGGWVENGEYPWNPERLGKVVQDISYNNAVNYFRF